MRRFAFILGICLLAATLIADDQTKQPAGSAMQAATDEQGQLRPPTAEEAKALAAASHARPPVERSVRVHAYGFSIALDESFDHTYVVRTDEDGNLVFTCTDDHQEAAAFTAKTASIDTILRVKPKQQPAPRIAERE